MGEDHLQRFAQAVVELQTKKEQRVDEETVRQVARDLGMTDEDLQKAREESHARKLRAQALRTSGNVDDAVKELELGYGFNPLDLEMMYMLADGLFNQSQRDRDQVAWSRARDLCLQVIEAAPAHKEAPSLLNAINHNEPAKKGDNNGAIAVVVAVGVVVLLLAGVLLHFVVGLF